MKTVVALINALLEPSLQPSALPNREIKKMPVIFRHEAQGIEYLFKDAYIHNGSMYVEIDYVPLPPPTPEQVAAKIAEQTSLQDTEPTFEELLERGQAVEVHLVTTKKRRHETY